MPLKIIYTREKIEKHGPVVFLAGPTPRSPDIKSWRPEAIKIFKASGFVIEERERSVLPMLIKLRVVSNSQ